MKRRTWNHHRFLRVINCGCRFIVWFFVIFTHIRNMNETTIKMTYDIFHSFAISIQNVEFQNNYRLSINFINSLNLNSNYIALSNVQFNVYINTLCISSTKSSHWLYLFA